MQLLRTVRAFALVGTVILVLSACSVGGVPPVGGIGPDPTISFTPITKNCDDTAAVGITYNVYAVPGAGPMVTVLTNTAADIVPATCRNLALIDTTKATKLNTAPVTTPTGNKFSVATSGQWTFCVEAVASDGTTRGPIGGCDTKNVSASIPLGPTGTQVTLNGLQMEIVVAQR